MFDGLKDFALQRTAKQALGWYIVYFIGFIVVAFVLGALIGLIMGNGDTESLQAVAFRFGVVLAIVGTGVLGYMLLKAKDLLNNVVWIVVILVAMGLAYVGGALLSFIPLAYLTTKGEKGEVSH